MRVITWNIHGAKKESLVWKLILELQPDILLLQEIGSIPDEINNAYEVRSKIAICKTGKPQRFSTGILVKGKIVEEITLSSEYEWVNKELEFFKGNLISYLVQLKNNELIHVVSVYNLAWAIDNSILQEIDISPVKLKLLSQVWGTDIIWSALKNTISNNEKWIVGGDYNTSETFDKEWQDKNGQKFGKREKGNKEILDRMYNLGFTECLRAYNNDKITPTYKNLTDSKVVHQMDHMFVTNNLYSKLNNCMVGDQSIIFGKSLSDHLPIIADFSDK